MRILVAILIFLPAVVSAQTMTDSTNVINPSNQAVIRFTTSYQATGYVNGDSLRFRSGSSKRVGLMSPVDLPINTATQTVIDGKQATLVSGTNIKTVNGNNLLGSGDVSISGTAAWGSVTGTLSNQTDLQNALNAKQASGSYAVTTNNLSDLSNATTARSNLGLVIGTNVLAPNGNGSALTGLTASQVSLGNVTNESKATMFTNPAFTGTPTGIGIPVYARVTGSNATTTGQSLVTITGLSIALVANAVYEVECMLIASTTAVTTGTGYGINYSAAGATIEGFVQGSATTTADKTLRLNAFNTSSQAWLTTSAQTGGILIKATVTVGANAGNLTAQHLKVTSGTSTVFIGAYMKVTRII